ncbi:MAG: hypothetical protein M3N68_05265 [Actinomycetota bacterium]|nr:hypothetical protein [Actinomycetota bacterium]
MATDRYVVLGLAQARSSWFRSMSQWTTSGTIPAEFVKCVSAEELRARLASGRPFSAVLVDAGLAALDRDLVDAAYDAGCAVVAIDDRRGRDWEALGVSAILPEFFDPKALLDTLRVEAAMISGSDDVPGDAADDVLQPSRAEVAVVCGPGGTGTSTVAIGLAQALGGDGHRHRGGVVLADLALHAEQAMLHDTRDVVPGVQELVEAHRSHRPTPHDVRSLCFQVEQRGYHLLLGLRQTRAWSALRPRAFTSAFESLQSAFGVVVCDTDADLEGEDEGGSIEVEERHLMSRTAVSRADVVFAVGLPGMKGLHALVRVVNDLRSFGVPSSRLVPVFNRAAKGAPARAELTAALAALTASPAEPLPTPIFLPDKRIEEVLRDGTRLPDSLTQPLAGAFAAVADNARELPGVRPGEGRPVRPGSLGSWGADAEEAAFG